MGSAIPPAGPRDRERTQLPTERGVIISTNRLTALRGAVLAPDPGCPALADTKAIAKHHRPPGAGGPGLPITRHDNGGRGPVRART
jgi:hypothetical protein